MQGRNLGKRSMTRGTKCSGVITRSEACPNPVDEGELYCWDHRCSSCGAAKMNKVPACRTCSSLVVPLPPDGPFFAPQLALPVGCSLRSAYGDVTGTSALMEVYFHPKTGLDRSSIFVECRDHIFASNDLRACSVLPPPKHESVRGLPNLCWPSDHLALVADLEWIEVTPTAADLIAEQQADEKQHVTAAAVDSAAEAVPVKRQKSDPGPRLAEPPNSASAAAEPPRPPPRGGRVRSWGERSLRASLS
mmetsp:Transcript_1074/g.2330  ORF Transcript_1074/g.2330 Transcript_1074/m.2330 type:complete len:248 (+) Transcript_1074:772-1515(+)